MRARTPFTHNNYNDFYEQASGSLALALSRTCFHLPRSSSITVHRMHCAMVIIITIAFAAMNIPHHSDYRYYAIIISLISLLRRV